MKDSRMRIAVISSVPPISTMGGEVILYRHLKSIANAEILVITDKECEGIEFPHYHLPQWKWWTRLERTRFSLLMHFLGNIYFYPYDMRSFFGKINSFKPDIILTVAAGKLQWIASLTSSRKNIPLVSFFHDAWPEMIPLSSFCRRLIRNKFIKLSKKSSKALCVSEGIISYLGNSKNIELLYPLCSEEIELTLDYQKSGNDRRLFYGGNISDIYGGYIRDICRVIQRDAGFSFYITGSNPDWNLNEILVRNPTIRYLGLLDSDEMSRECLKADILIVLMSFREKDCIRMETSFPSKFIQYLQFEKPIAIWAPEYSTIAQFARKQGLDLCFTEPDADLFVGEIKSFLSDQNRITKSIEIIRRLKNGEFNPDQIKKKFEVAMEETYRFKMKKIF